MYRPASCLSGPHVCPLLVYAAHMYDRFLSLNFGTCTGLLFSLRHMSSPTFCLSGTFTVSLFVSQAHVQFPFLSLRHMYSHVLVPKTHVLSRFLSPRHMCSFASCLPGTCAVPLLVSQAHVQFRFLSLRHMYTRKVALPVFDWHRDFLPNKLAWSVESELQKMYRLLIYWLTGVEQLAAEYEGRENNIKYGAPIPPSPWVMIRSLSPVNLERHVVGLSVPRSLL